MLSVKLTKLTEPSFNPDEILRKALYGTYMVLRKFEQSISKLSKDMEKLRRTYHMLKMAWRISFATLFIGIFILALLGSEFAVQLGIYTIISSTVGLALSTFFTLRIRKFKHFYMAGLIEKPPESIMKVIVVGEDLW